MLAKRITEVILSGMEANIPYSFPSTKPNKPWFNSTCSRAIRRSDAAFRDYRRVQTPETHSTYISSRNRAKSILRDSINSFSVANAIIFLVPLRLALSVISGKNVNSNFASSSFPPLVSSDGTTDILPSTKTESLAQTFVLILP